MTIPARSFIFSRIKGHTLNSFARALSLLFLFGAPLLSQAREFEQGPVATLFEENDLFVRTDRHYTQGIKISYLQADNHLPGFMAALSDNIPALGFTNYANKFGYEIGQNMYTPRDLAIAGPQPNDHPWSGWLYTGVILQRRGLTSGGIGVLENIQLDLGVIGPWSLAKEAQTWIHQMRNFSLPQGWGNQLKNEPGVDLKYERSWRLQFPSQNPHFVDFIPRAGFNLGNIETSARVGGTLRLGWHLPNNFAPQMIDSITTPEGGRDRDLSFFDNLGFYCFMGGEGKAVGYMARFDGNLFRPGAHITKNNLVTSWYCGGAVVCGRLEGGFSYVLRSRDFIGQPAVDSFGSIFFKVRL